MTMRIFFFACLVIFIGGCSSLAGIPASVGAMPVHEIETFDGPRQEIFRVDESRYITIEGYRDCHVGGIMRWHDDRQGIHAVMQSEDFLGSGYWYGKYSIDPGDQKLAVATFGCSDRQCYLWINFSNDGGQTWDSFPSEQFGRESLKGEPKKNLPRIAATEVRVTRDGLIYVIPEHGSFHYRYRLDGSRDQWVPSTAIVDEREGLYDSDNMDSIPVVKTPSGQDRFDCDASLNPKPRQE